MLSKCISENYYHLKASSKIHKLQSYRNFCLYYSIKLGSSVIQSYVYAMKFTNPETFLKKI